MDAQTCLNKLRYVGVLSFATVDGEGNPQVRNISAIHYEPDALYFFTARGKDFCKELLARGKVQILGYTRYKEMIRLSGTAAPVPPGSRRSGGTSSLRSSPISPMCTLGRPGALAWCFASGTWPSSTSTWG